MMLRPPPRPADPAAGLWLEVLGAGDIMLAAATAPALLIMAAV